MPVAIEVSREPDYAELKVAGPWTEATARQVIDRARMEADGAGQQRILLDLTDFEPPKDEMVRYYSGVYLAEVLLPPFRIGAFSKPSSINRFAMTVAVNRGVCISVFPERQAAVDWLLSDARP
ncbi:MAG: hypothetical protein L6R28_12715 [Planctomycetes bacterium]|nr:hypothetical protein [Planctomycetota bacterium]